MRTRPLVALSTMAAAVLLLAGCTGTDGTTGDDAESASGDLCSATVESGAAAESVKVDGDFGTASTATFDLEQKVDEAQRSVLSEGDGEKIADGDYVQYALSAFDGDSGDRLGDAGYTEGELLPVQLTADVPMGQLIGCATVGSRLSIVFPTTEDAAAQYYVLDVLDVVPTAAWGKDKEPTAGMPAVTLAEDGQPSVEIPEGDAPSELQVSVLKEGDGIAVEDGDTTLLQYYGVDWSTGESFDSSWKNGAPISIDGNTYVPGFVEALKGQKAGSQVLVVIPPSLGYGEEGSSDHELAGKTLVFVIDILATMHPAAAAQ
ncbi:MULTISPECIES: FKBP-type peptidyl-prolyl cis-trans isomerase [unclassified Microbacterium]|uniref:FKBP-type peptidyl-prolyl cis-trans isomerase n=1 Tax=unclassified Microbacterium TaxID=2609290 RepID=UPI001E4F68D1|nr:MULTISPECIES: FKBP-type peptidyl-prolyl cis-trans isomerase [unclassified Microbacterium]HWK77370.1 FKBP-type peptidyl-prolyl cis-trans isomerase [Microbacterium sp.]